MADRNRNTLADKNILQDDDVLYKIASFQYHETLDNLMEKDVFTCGPNESVQNVAVEMAKRRISSVVVIDEKCKPLGIVTERDIVKKVVAESRCHIHEKKMGEIMTPDPVCLPPEGSLFDALSILSRSAIKHLPIVHGGRVVGIVTTRQIMKVRHAEPFVIIGQLGEAKTTADFKAIKDELIYLVREKLAANTDPVDVVTMLTLINAGIHKRLLKKTFDEQKTAPPVDFCFFVTGSHGRKENLLFPDQDFCVIIEDYDDRNFNEFDAYFYEVSRMFSDQLHEVGYAYCSGNIMGQNPTWRKRISEWKAHISYIFNKPGPFTVRYLTLVFDSARLYGSTSLFDSYMNHAYTELSNNRNILRQMHDDEEARHKVPLGLFSTFITEKNKEHKGEIDMKKSGLIFIIEAVRILAMKHAIRETSTLKRLQALAQKRVIHKDDSEYFENAYRVILYHTLKAQVDNYLKKSSGDYYLLPRELSPRNQEILKEAFRAISRLQDLVGSEFGELIV